MEAGFDTRRVAANGVALNLIDVGSGPAVVLLHGFPDSAALWRHQIPVLVDAGYRVLAPDLRGFGSSDKPEDVNAYRVQHSVEDVVALLDDAGEETATIVGHDWGAVVSWAFAASEPGRTRGLVALGVGHSAAFPAGGIAQMIRSSYVMFFQMRGVTERLLSLNDWMLFRLMFSSSPDVDRYLRDLARPGALTAGLNWYRANVPPSRLLAARGLVGRVTAPTLGIWSSRDPALSEAQMKASAEYVAAPWRYERFEGVGHWIPTQAPDPLNVVLLDFLSRDGT